MCSAAYSWKKARGCSTASSRRVGASRHRYAGSRLCVSVRHPAFHFMEQTMRASIAAFAGLTAFAATAALAAPVTYEVDTKHAHVGFEADHFGGVSVWRGIISGGAGKIVLDTEAKTGTVDISVEPATVTVGRTDLEDHL